MKSLIPSFLAASGGGLLAWPWLDERAFAAAWLGMVLVVSISIGQQPHVAFRRSLLAGLIGLAIAFHWFPAVAARNLHVSLLSGITTSTLAITWDAFRFGICAWLAAKLYSRGIRTVLVWPVVWVALEWSWPHVFPWRLGTSQLGWLPVCQIAEVTGVYGVSFLMVWTAAVGAELLRDYYTTAAGRCPAGSACATVTATNTDTADVTRQINRPGRRIKRHAVCCAGGVAAIIIWGQWRIADFDARASARPSLTVALIQPGSLGDDHLRRLRQMSLAVRRNADMIVWPESCVDDFSLALNSFRSLAEVQQHTAFDDDSRPCHGLQTPLLCGGGSFPEGSMGTGPFHNTAFLVDADEDIVGRYHKRFLMPWGEYVVGQQWIPGVATLLGSSNNRAGESATPLSLPDGPKLGVLICYEDLLAEPVRQTVVAGAEVLLNLNNLSIFGKTPALFQHQQIARFRAIENRRCLLRCGVIGSTAVIGPAGRVEQQASHHDPQTVISAAPLLESVSFYTRWGDVFAYGCLAATVLMSFRRRVT